MARNEEGINPYLPRYRVIDPKSTHYGQEGFALHKETVRRDYGYGGGRSKEWYEGWDILLNLPTVGEMGIGFAYDEVELCE